MSRRHIVICDRCGAEIFLNGVDIYKVWLILRRQGTTTTTDPDIELWPGCATDFYAWLEGQETLS